jgi:hypothetical protein
MCFVPAAASLEFSGAVVRVNPRVAKAAFGLLVNSRPKQKQPSQQPVDVPVAPRSAPRTLLQKRATMQLLLPLLQESGYASDTGSMKTMSDIADAALLALWLQRARAAAAASADHATFSAAYPAAAEEFSAPLLHQVTPDASQPVPIAFLIHGLWKVIGQLGWKPAAAKDVSAIVPGDASATFAVLCVPAQ